MLAILLGLVLFFIFIILIVIFVLIYNKFQRLNNGAEAGIAQIEVALKKRMDMITQLVEVVKSYAKFEKEVMESITKLRSKIGKKSNPEDLSNINNEISKLLDRILLVVENYPDLKASKNVTDLMDAIRDNEDEISRQRYTYNNIVQEYNTKLGMIPSNLVAKIFSYDKLEYLKFEKEISTRPSTEWNK